VKAGVQQYPNHLTTKKGWKRSPSNSIGGYQGEGPLAGSSPVDEFGLGDREVHTYVLAPCTDSGEVSWQMAYIASMRGRGPSD